MLRSVVPLLFSVSRVALCRPNRTPPTFRNIAAFSYCTADVNRKTHLTNNSISTLFRLHFIPETAPRILFCASWRLTNSWDLCIVHWFYFQNCNGNTDYRYVGVTSNGCNNCSCFRKFAGLPGLAPEFLDPDQWRNHGGLGYIIHPVHTKYFSTKYGPLTAVRTQTVKCRVTARFVTYYDTTEYDGHSRILVYPSTYLMHAVSI